MEGRQIHPLLWDLGSSPPLNAFLRGALFPAARVRERLHNHRLRSHHTVLGPTPLHIVERVPQNSLRMWGRPKRCARPPSPRAFQQEAPTLAGVAHIDQHCVPVGTKAWNACATRGGRPRPQSPLSTPTYLWDTSKLGQIGFNPSVELQSPPAKPISAFPAFPPLPGAPPKKWLMSSQPLWLEGSTLALQGSNSRSPTN